MYLSTMHTAAALTAATAATTAIGGGVSVYMRALKTTALG